MQMIRGAICSLHGRRLKRARQRGGHARKKPSQAPQIPRALLDQSLATDESLRV